MTPHLPCVWFISIRTPHLEDPWTTRVGLFLVIAPVTLVPLSVMAEDQHTAVQADGIKRAAGPGSLLKGAQIAVLFGIRQKGEAVKDAETKVRTFLMEHLERPDSAKPTTR